LPPNDDDQRCKGANRRIAPQARTRAAPDGAKAKRTDVRAGD
jgi:hypothetical protein